MNTARGDVSCDEDLNLSVLHAAQCTLPLGLGAVAVGGGVVAGGSVGDAVVGGGLVGSGACAVRRPPSNRDGATSEGSGLPEATGSALGVAVVMTATTSSDWSLSAATLRRAGSTAISWDTR